MAMEESRTLGRGAEQIVGMVPQRLSEGFDPETIVGRVPGSLDVLEQKGSLAPKARDRKCCRIHNPTTQMACEAFGTISMATDTRSAEFLRDTAARAAALCLNKGLLRGNGQSLALLQDYLLHNSFGLFNLQLRSSD